MNEGGRSSALAIEPNLRRDAALNVTHWVLMALYIGAVYLAVVVALGSMLNTQIPNTGLAVVAMTIVALTFGRVRSQVLRAAARLVAGERVTPEEVLQRFSEGISQSVDPAETLTLMSEAVARGVGAARTDVWVRAGDELFVSASWPAGHHRRLGRRRLSPDGLPPFPEARLVAPVSHRGELLGVLTVSAADTDRLTPGAAALLDDLASQAGPVLRNVRLNAELAARLDELQTGAAELRASRARIVEAQDAERRRLERDIHDGAQQYLVALAVKARMARTVAERDPARMADLVAELRTLTASALENLRDLVHGIYPPTLAAEGLGPALRAQARRAGLRARVSARGFGRVDPVIEAAVYFACLEAMQNAAKHAGGGNIRVAIERDDDEVRFTVSDDGPGFDIATIERGSGLTNMDDRVSVLGGRLDISSAPGDGTTVSGRIPLRTTEIQS